MLVRDLTGSGKTLAFCLPLIERLRAEGNFKTGKTQAIILAPTRELAMQISRTLIDLKHYKSEYDVITVYGGTSFERQKSMLKRGVDIFVGTCGRVLDHMQQGNIDFSQTQCVVLDEADELLNMGFKDDVDTIFKQIKDQSETRPQFLLFSATVPNWVRDLTSEYLSDDHITLDLAKNLKDRTQKNINHISMICPYVNRMSALADILTIYGGLGQTIVFCSTKA